MRLVINTHGPAPKSGRKRPKTGQRLRDTRNRAVESARRLQISPIMAACLWLFRYGYGGEGLQMRRTSAPWLT